MDLSVITVTWNSAEHIAKQILSVGQACDGLQYEQIIVDNASSDTTAQIVGAENFLPVQLIKNNHNTGFAAANNSGATKSTGEFLLFLNPDMEVRGTLKPMIDWLRAHPDVGVAGGRLEDARGTFELRGVPRRFPTWKDQLAIVLKLPHIIPTVLDTYLMKGFDPSLEQDVDSVRGSFIFVRRELVEKLGFAFDPRYYIWYEDVDTCREAKRLGYRVVYNPIASSVDHIGRSFRKRSFLWKQWQFIRSMALYFRKWR